MPAASMTRLTEFAEVEAEPGVCANAVKAASMLHKRNA
jgi:hypothetical protein